MNCFFSKVILYFLKKNSTFLLNKNHKPLFMSILKAFNLDGDNRFSTFDINYHFTQKPQL